MSDGFKHMTFAAFEDAACTVPVAGLQPYEVLLNPETFDRTVSVRKVASLEAQKNGDKGLDAGTEAETYSFDLMFDGTGVAGRAFTGDGLKKELQTFLNVVYRARKSSSPGTPGDGDAVTQEGAKQNEVPPVYYVEINYCGERFCTKLDSLTIKYLLFQKDGNPLRIKVSCRFSAADDPAVIAPAEQAETDPTEDLPPVTDETKNKECINPRDSYEDTVDTAKKNDALSLLTACYAKVQMVKNYIDLGKSLIP